MEWLAFSYSLPSKGQSSPRVALWRRLQRLGAVSITGGVYILPSQPDCVEAFQWLAQEVHHATGEAVVMRVERFDTLTEADIIERFNAARAEAYGELDEKLAELAGSVTDDAIPEVRLAALETLEKLRKSYAEIVRVDYFQSREGAALGAKLREFGQALTEADEEAPAIEPVDVEAFRGKTWVTRPRPHVDRLASIWLIRRFIDPDARIRYGHAATNDEVSFDMPSARFGHVGNRCTFETLIASFRLTDAGLKSLAEVVHEIDLQDGRYARPETLGIDAVLEGWRRLDLTDEELEAHGVALFEGLYSALSKQPSMATEASTPSEANLREA